MIIEQGVLFDKESPPSSRLSADHLCHCAFMLSAQQRVLCGPEA